MNCGDLEHFGPYQALPAAYLDEVRRLLERVLIHFDEVTECQWDPLGSIGRPARIDNYDNASRR